MAAFRKEQKGPERPEWGASPTDSFRPHFGRLAEALFFLKAGVMLAVGTLRLKCQPPLYCRTSALDGSQVCPLQLASELQQSEGRLAMLQKVIGGLRVFLAVSVLGCLGGTAIAQDAAAPREFTWVQTETGVELCSTRFVGACAIDGNTFRIGVNRYRLFDTYAPSSPTASCPSEAARYWVGMTVLATYSPKVSWDFRYVHRGYDDDGVELVEVEVDDGDLAQLLLNAAMLSRSKDGWC